MAQAPRLYDTQAQQLVATGAPYPPRLKPSSDMLSPSSASPTLLASACPCPNYSNTLPLLTDFDSIVVPATSTCKWFNHIDTSIHSSTPCYQTMGRRVGRITKEDILEAGFRRWDGRQRVTTDWTNVFNVRALLSAESSNIDTLRNLSFNGPTATSWSIYANPGNPVEDQHSASTPPNSEQKDSGHCLSAASSALPFLQRRNVA